MLLALMIIVLSFGVYACAAIVGLNREMARADRDPVTGIVRGCEPRTLDPPATVAGDHPTSACLLLHGFLGAPSDWNDLPERLAARGYHVRVPLMPGHGTTPRDFAAQTPESILAGAAEELRALEAQYDEVTLMGFSMGGAVATLLAADPETRASIDRLVLVSPYYGVTYMWYYVLPAEFWTRLMAPVLPWVRKSEFFIKVNRVEAKEQLFSYLTVPTRGGLTLMELGDRARSVPTLAAVRCPVLLVMAEGDEAASPARARQAYAGMVNADKQAAWFTKRSNHHVLWDYDRVEAREAILRFVTGVGEGRTTTTTTMTTTTRAGDRSDSD